MSDQQNLIADLEAETEHLRDAAERCRKIDLGTKLAVALGVACLASAVVWFKPVALVFGVALLLGGIALHGSSRSTLARRAELIDTLQLQIIESRQPAGDL